MNQINEIGNEKPKAFGKLIKSTLYIVGFLIICFLMTFVFDLYYKLDPEPAFLIVFKQSNNNEKNNAPRVGGIHRYTEIPVISATFEAIYTSTITEPLSKEYANLPLFSFESFLVADGSETPVKNGSYILSTLVKKWEAETAKSVPTEEIIKFMLLSNDDPPGTYKIKYKIETGDRDSVAGSLTHLTLRVNSLSISKTDLPKVKPENEFLISYYPADKFPGFKKIDLKTVLNLIKIF